MRNEDALSISDAISASPRQKMHVVLDSTKGRDHLHGVEGLPQI